MNKYGTAIQATDDNLIRRTRVASCRHTLRIGRTLIAFPRQQQLRERALMLCCLSCVQIILQEGVSKGKLTYLLTPWSRVLLEKLTSKL